MKEEITDYTPTAEFTPLDPFEDLEVIHTYTRAEAIEDGVLVDISELAKEAGFKWPVAMTRTFFESLKPNKYEADLGQDHIGRLWDLLTMFRVAAKKGGDRIDFYFLMQLQDGRMRPNSALRKMRNVGGGMAMHRQQVKALCGPGDHFEPVITIMLPDED